MVEVPAGVPAVVVAGSGADVVSTEVLDEDSFARPSDVELDTLGRSDASTAMDVGSGSLESVDSSELPPPHEEATSAAASKNAMGRRRLLVEVIMTRSVDRSDSP